MFLTLQALAGPTSSDFQPGKATPTSGCPSMLSGPALLESPHWIPTTSTSRILPSALSQGAGTWQMKSAVIPCTAATSLTAQNCLPQGLSTCSTCCLSHCACRLYLTNRPHGLTACHCVLAGIWLLTLLGEAGSPQARRCWQQMTTRTTALTWK